MTIGRFVFLAGLSMATVTASVGTARADDNGEVTGSLTGHYYLSGMREVGSELLLQQDGRFRWMLAYGALDMTAEGSWSREDGAVVLTPDEPGARQPSFRLGEKGAWNDRATHFLEQRREAEARDARRTRCPLSFVDEGEDGEVAAVMFGQSGTPTPSERERVTADLDRARKEAQATLDRLRNHPGWQDDRERVASVDRALGDFQNARAAARDAYDRSGTALPDIPRLDLPPECALDDWQAEAARFRGVAVHVFDVERYQRGDGIWVEARYDEGAPARDLVTAGYAFLPLAAGRRIVELSLRSSGKADAPPTLLKVDIREPAIQLVDADLPDSGPVPFRQMRLTIGGDGTLTPQDMLRGVYSRDGR